MGQHNPGIIKTKTVWQNNTAVSGRKQRSFLGGTVQLLKLSAVSACLAFIGATGWNALHAPTASAACTPTTTYGSDMLSINVPSASTYRVWVRMMVPDTTNKSLALEVDGGNCITVGGGTMTASTWTWVDYKDGNSATKNELTLTAGLHAFNLIGTMPGVAVDRVILTSDLTCVPTGVGDNCADPGDTMLPTVALTTPANGATVSGSSVNVSATASDDTQLAKVELYINSTLVATCTSSPCSVAWDTTAKTNGSYTIYAKAYDAAGNSKQSDSRTVTVSNTVPDTTKPTVSVTAPASGSTVSGTVTFSATASDNVGVTKVEFSVDGTVKSTDTTSPYAASIDTTALSNASHTLSAKAYDAAGNTQTASTTVTVNNSSGGGTPTPPAKAGDANGDKVVNFADVILVAAHYNQTVTAYTYGDVNGDGKVNFQDVIVVAANYGK